MTQRNNLFSEFTNQLTVTGPNQSFFNRLKNESRPFEIVKYPGLEDTEISKAFLKRKDELLAGAKKFLTDFKIPLPEDKEQREAEIKKAVEYYKEIGDGIENDLREALTKDRNEWITKRLKENRGDLVTALGEKGIEVTTDEEIREKVREIGLPSLYLQSDTDIANLSHESTKNFLFLTTKDDDLTKSYFFNDVIMYYHDNDQPEKKFDEFLTDRFLATKKTSKANKIEQALPYVKMVSGDYFINLIKDNPALQKKFVDVSREAIIRDKNLIRSEIKKLESDLKKEQKNLDKSIKENRKEISITESELENTNTRLKNMKNTDEGFAELSKNKSALTEKLRKLKPQENKVNNLKGMIEEKKKLLTTIDPIQNFKDLIEPGRQCIIKALKGSLDSKEHKNLILEAKRLGFLDADIKTYAAIGKQILDQFDIKKDLKLRLALSDAWSRIAADHHNAFLLSHINEMRKNYALPSVDKVIAVKADGQPKKEFEELASLIKDFTSIQKNYEKRWLGLKTKFFPSERKSEHINAINEALVRVIYQYPKLNKDQIVETMKTELGTISRKMSNEGKSALLDEINKFIEKLDAKQMNRANNTP